MHLLLVYNDIYMYNKLIVLFIFLFFDRPKAWPRSGKAPLLQEFAKMDLNGKDEKEIVNQLEALMNSDAGKSVFQQQVGNGGSNLP